MDEQVLRLLGQKDYAPSNVPEMLRLLCLSPNRQQELQRVLRGLEHSGQIARTKGNRYILSREADLIPGLIRSAGPCTARPRRWSSGSGLSMRL